MTVLRYTDYDVEAGGFLRPICISEAVTHLSKGGLKETPVLLPHLTGLYYVSMDYN